MKLVFRKPHTNKYAGETDQEALLREIIVKGNKLKIAQTAFLFLMLVGVAIIIAYSVSTQQENHKLLQQVATVIDHQNQISTTRHDQTVQVDNYTTSEINKIDAELQCFGQFFGQSGTSRTNSAITNLSQCSINYTGASGGSTGATKSP